MRWPRRRTRHHVKRAEEATEKNERLLEQIKERDGQVRALTNWARQTREANHLTELFINGLQGKKA